MKSNIIGINCSLQSNGKYTFDGNVALIRDGELIMAVAEERVSRKKYDGHFRHALNYVLERTKTSVESIEAVAVSTFAQPTEEEAASRYSIQQAVKDVVGANVNVSIAPSHHEIHALSAASQCGVEESLIVVIDNEGSIIGSRSNSKLWENRLERTSYYLFKDDRLTLLERDHDGFGEVGFGKAYSKVTRFVGFESYHQAGKTMGLAPFGNPHLLSSCQLFQVCSKRGVKTTMQNSDNGLADLKNWFKTQAIDLPAPRAKQNPIRPIDMQLSRWIQEELEKNVTRRLALLLNKYKVRHLCMSGGVSLNSVMNYRLLTELPVDDVFVPPSPGDAGLALGAAAWYLWKQNGIIPKWTAKSYLGGEYSTKEIEKYLSQSLTSFTIRHHDDPARAAAQILSKGGIIGWFQGASEYGPRALGNRSILADPRNVWMKDIVNHQVKMREWFRPYAPSILLKKADEYFHLNKPEPFMMKIAHTKEAAKISLPACVHVDETSRLQTVTEEDCPLYAHLLESFYELTDVPAVLNTSFNLNGMPIVESPQDAIDCFLKSPHLNRLFLGNLEISRS